MVLQNVSVIQGDLSQNLRNASVLHSGSVVSGRVLARNADGSYSVSLAGQKINVKSQSPLQAGSVFSARVSIKNGSVQLALVKESSSSEILQKFGGIADSKTASSEIPPQLANLLSSLGFEPNAESFKILQFMQQIGIKIDADSAKKALKEAGDSDSKEEKGQIALLLEEKGIKSSSERVQAVIGRNPDSSKDRQKDKNHDAKENNGGKGKVFGGAKFSASNVKSYFSQVDEASSASRAGLLTAFNTVLSGARKEPPLKHWILLPFEWNFCSYSGHIRLLFDSELSRLEKVVIDLNNSSKSHVFVLYYKNAEVASVKFASDSEFSESKKSRLCQLLSSMFNKKISVEMEDFASLRGFCSSDEKFSLLDGSV